jgi:hypothetical protein
LASPDVDDPLVPEIAAKYLEDYEGYCENARLYTKKFATDSRRPDSDILRFLEDSKPNEPASAFPEPDNDIKSLQDSLRRAYDTEAFTTSKTTSWKADFASTANSDSIDTTRDNISSSAGQSLDQALLSIFGWPNGRDLLKSSYLNSNYLVATLEALASKEDLEKFLWQATEGNSGPVFERRDCSCSPLEGRLLFENSVCKENEHESHTPGTFNDLPKP